MHYLILASIVCWSCIQFLSLFLISTKPGMSVNLQVGSICTEV